MMIFQLFTKSMVACSFHNAASRNTLKTFGETAVAVHLRFNMKPADQAELMIFGGYRGGLRKL